MRMKDGYGSLKTATALLNSKVLDWYLKKVSTTFHGGYFAANKQFLVQLPFITTTDVESRQIDSLVDWLLFLCQQPSVRAATKANPRDPQLAAWFERWVDAIVYELFFPEELEARGLKFLSLAEEFALPTPISDAHAEETLQSARITVERLSEPGHSLRRALDKLQTLDLVRTVEGSA